jgi:putative ABC transport system permease protein
VWRATLKGLLAHRWRLLRTSLAVALGVGFVAGTYVLTDTMRQKIDDIIATGSEDQDVVVRAETTFADIAAVGTEAPVYEGLLPVIESIDGVANASGSVYGTAVMIDERGEAIQPMGPPTLGGNWDGTQYDLVEGRTPTGLTDVVVDDVTAESHGFAVGDDVRIVFQGSSEEFQIVGIMKLPASYMGATMALFDLPVAQRVLGFTGSFNSIAVRAEPGVSDGQLRDRVAAVLPKGFEAVTTAAAAADVKEQLDRIMGFVETALLAFAAVALFVGAFIIFNTFSILVAQRTREIGLLRAVGATQAQVILSVLAEAIVVGVVASLVGLALGVVFAQAMIALLGAFGMEFAGTALQFRPRTAVVAMLAGSLVTVVSALAPARRATQVPPVVAIGGAFRLPARSLRRRVIVGGLVTAFGVGSLLVGLFADVPDALAVVGLGALATFIGVGMLSALIARPLAAVVGGPFARASEPAHLGRQNAMRSPRRTASTAAALMIGVGLVGFVTITAASVKASATSVIEDSMRADYVLQAGTVASSSGGVSADIAERLREEPAVGVVSQVKVGQFGLDDAATTLSAVDPVTLPQVMDVGTGDLAAIGALRDTGVLLRERVAQDHGWKVGDVIEMVFQKVGAQEVGIQGLFELSGFSSDFLITLGAYERDFVQGFDAQVYVLAAPDASPAALDAALERAVAPYPTVTVQDKAEFIESQTSQIDGLLAFMQALLGLSILIALLGIANTLGLSIIERTRELGLLRAVGMSRGQLRSMVRWEAVIIGVMGALLGLVIGVFFGWALVRALREEGVTEFAVPLAQLGLYVAIAAVAAIVAAWLPARRASKLDILSAIVTE